MSNTSPDPPDWLCELPEPDPFTREEFLAWRGLIRLHGTMTRQIDRRLRERGEISIDDYGVLIVFVTAPGLRLRMTDLAERQMLTPSGSTRLVARLEERGLVQRVPDPDDGRGSLAALTHEGLETFRRAQVIHHAAVRELFVGRLTARELEQLARLYEKAMPGIGTEAIWPPSEPA